MATTYNLGSVSSYAIARQYGFSGTEAEWVQAIINASGNYDDVKDMVEALEGQIPEIDSTLTYNDRAANAYEVGQRFAEPLTEGRFSDELKLQTIKDYVTPEMFGAKMDGETDDSEAFQECVNYASEHGFPIKITKDILIDDNITIPSYVRIDGATHYEYYPRIIVGANCTVLFNCTGVCNIFTDFVIQNYNSDYRSLDGIVFNGGQNNNVDSEVINVRLAYMDRCIVVKGRNVKLTECSFVKARVGVYYDLPDTSSQYRGLQIESCRFHEIGSYADLNWFENSACIWIEENRTENLTVRNCIADESGTFFYGHCCNALISNNFVESFKMPPVVLEGTGLPANISSILFEGNTFNGKSGLVTWDDRMPYPDHIVTIDTIGRVNFVGNIFRNCNYEGVSISNSQLLSFLDNIFVNLGIEDSNKKTAFLCDSSTNISFIGNTQSSSGFHLFSAPTNASSDSTLYVKSNSRFVFDESPSKITVFDNKRWVLLGTWAYNAAPSFDLPDEFLVRMNDGKTAFHCCKYGSYVTGGMFMDTDASKFRTLTIAYETDKYIAYLREFTVSTMAQSRLGSTLYVYKLIN